jgi:serine protease Do
MSTRISNNRPLLDFGLFPIRTIIIFLIMSSCFYERTASGALSETFISVAKNIKPSVVNIITTKALKRDMPNRGKRDPFNDVFPGDLPHKQSRKEPEINSQCSGVIVDKKGYIVTNDHVVKGADELIVKLYDYSEFKAELVGSDPKTDIAVLKIDAEDLKSAEFGNSDSLEIGEIVLAIGISSILEQTVTSGIISAKGKPNMLIAGYENLLLTDAAINSSNTGGPLVNLQGKVVGINTTITPQIGDYSGISFTIPINIVRKVVEGLIAHGRVTRSWLGVTAQTITPQLQEILGLKDTLGALVSDIEPNSPAAYAGLKSGDLVVKYDGKKIKDLFQLRNLVAETEINKEVEIAIMRDGKELKLKATILELSNGHTTDKKDILRNLGLVVQTLIPESATNLGYEGEKGVIITNIHKDSPAHKAGLIKDDLIIEVEHKPVAGIDDFQQAILNIPRGEDILIFIKRRDGTSRFVVLEMQDKVDG